MGGPGGLHDPKVHTLWRGTGGTNKEKRNGHLFDSDSFTFTKEVRVRYPNLCPYLGFGFRGLRIRT